MAYLRHFIEYTLWIGIRGQSPGLRASTGLDRQNNSLPTQCCLLITFATRSGPTKRPGIPDQARQNVQVFLKDLFEKVDFEKNQQTTKSQEKYLRGQRVKTITHSSIFSSKNQSYSSLKETILVAPSCTHM